jgi:hypothetical protein
VLLAKSGDLQLQLAKFGHDMIAAQSMQLAVPRKLDMYSVIFYTLVFDHVTFPEAKMMEDSLNGSNVLPSQCNSKRPEELLTYTTTSNGSGIMLVNMITHVTI